MTIGAVMAVAGLHTLRGLQDKIANPRPIEIWPLGLSAVSAIVIAVLVVLAPWRFRQSDNPVIRATWFSSRNDLVSTAGFAPLGLGARVAPRRWPEYLFDLFVAGLCFQAAWAVARSLRSASNSQQSDVRNKAATGPAGGL